MRKKQINMSDFENGSKLAGRGSAMRRGIGFRKSKASSTYKIGSLASSKDVYDLENPVPSAIRRLAANAACYIPTNGTESVVGNGQPAGGIRRSTTLGTARKLFHKKKTLKDARQRCKKGNAQWRTKLLDYVTSLRKQLSKKQLKLLEALLGQRAYCGPIRGSDIAATRQVGLICADVVHSYWLAVPGLRWFHITLLSDEFHVSERQPSLAIKRLKGKAYKQVQQLGLDGIGSIDVDPLPNYPQQGQGGTFLFHAHVLAWTDREFDIEQARRTLKKSRSWSCKLGASPTTIAEITQRKGTPAWWAVYDSKPPHRAKRRIVDADGKVCLSPIKAGYRPQIAMRLAEGLAQVGLLDLLFAVGEGKDLREDVRRRLMKWHRSRWPDQRPIHIRNIHSLFKQLWISKRVNRYKRWRVVGSSI